MKKKLLWGQNERVDVPDASALHDLTDETRRADSRALVSQTSEGPVVVRGFTCRVNPADNTQILVTPGVALMRELLANGTVEEGQTVNMEGEADEVVDLSGRPTPSDFGIWVRFIYRNGNTANRAKWRPDLSPEREQVVLMETRQIAGLTIEAQVNTPGPEWFQIASAHWDGGLVDTDLIDARKLLFEGSPSGTGNPASSWSTADFSRSIDRSTNGVKSLRLFISAVHRRLMEAAGRPKWYTAPIFGENVRSAGSAITVRIDGGGDVQTAHVTLDNGDPVANRTSLAALFIAPNAAAQTTDPRGDITFIPSDALIGTDTSIFVDCSAGSVVGLGTGYRRRIGGAARLWRSAGNNDLIGTDPTSGFRATFDGMTFYATAGTGPLFRSRSANDEIVFSNCTFDGSAAAAMTSLVKIEAAGARITFFNCRFMMMTGAGQTGVFISAEADVRFIGGSITGSGARCIYASASPQGLISAIGTVFSGAETIIQATDNDGMSFIGCRFGPTVTLFDVPGMTATAGDEAFYNAGTAARGLLSGNWLEARGSTVYFGTARNRTLTHTDRTITGTGSDGDLVDFVGRYLRAASGRVYLDTGDLRLSKASATVVELLDTAAVSPVASMLRMWRLLLGPSTATGLDQFNRNLLPKAWGVIRRDTGAAWSGTGDRAASRTGQLGDGYYESLTVRGNGTPLTVTGYFLDASGLYSTGHVLEWNAVNGATNNTDPEEMIFRVSGLGLPHKRYHVSATVESDDDFGFTVAAPNSDTNRKIPTVTIFKKEADSFFLAVGYVGAADGQVRMGIRAWLGVATEIRVGFTVHAICDSGSFVNGGVG